jgi:hypothetical protein
MTDREALVYAAAYALAHQRGDKNPAFMALGAVEKLRAEHEPDKYMGEFNARAAAMLDEFRSGG